MTPPLRVLVVDDQDVVRAGFAALLATQPDFVVVGTAADGAEAVRLSRERRPDVALMDVRMPVLDGIEATRRIAAGSDRPRIVSSGGPLNGPNTGCIRATSSGTTRPSGKTVTVDSAVWLMPATT